MCGIACVFRKDDKPAHKQTLKRYRKQKNRGQDGFGYVAIGDDNKVVRFKRFMFESEVVRSLEKTKYKQVLFHHRYPTSTANLPESAHPILVSHKELKYDYYVMHNGVLSNDDDLKEFHETIGYKYTTLVHTQWKTAKGVVYEGAAQWNDSEALAIELARAIEGISEKVEAKGSIAYVVLQVEKASKIAKNVYYGTNGGNPLTIQELDNSICIASEGGEKIPANQCFKMDMQTKEVSKFKLELIPYATYTMGYSVSGYSAFERDDDGYGTVYSTPAKGRDGYKTDAYDIMSAIELEEELEDTEALIIEAEETIQHNIEMGELEAEEIWKEELARLKKLHTKIEKAYATKSSEIPF